MPNNKPTETTAGALDTFDTIGQVEAWLTTPGYKIPWPDLDADQASAEISRRLMAAGDPLADDGEAQGADEVLGVSWRLLEVGFRRSTDPRAPEGSAYVLLRGATGDGEAIVVTTGARKVMARCVGLVRHNGLGRWVKIVRPSDDTGKTRAGRDFYDLVAGDEPVKG